jgi:hypothetical protein
MEVVRISRQVFQVEEEAFVDDPGQKIDDY